MWTKRRNRKAFAMPLFKITVEYITETTRSGTIEIEAKDREQAFRRATNKMGRHKSLTHFNETLSQRKCTKSEIQEFYIHDCEQIKE